MGACASFLEEPGPTGPGGAQAGDAARAAAVRAAQQQAQQQAQEAQRRAQQQAALAASQARQLAGPPQPPGALPRTPLTPEQERGGGAVDPAGVKLNLPLPTTTPGLASWLAGPGGGPAEAARREQMLAQADAARLALHRAGEPAGSPRDAPTVTVSGSSPVRTADPQPAPPPPAPPLPVRPGGPGSPLVAPPTAARPAPAPAPAAVSAPAPAPVPAPAPAPVPVVTASPPRVAAQVPAPAPAAPHNPHGLAPWQGDGALFFPDDKLPCWALLRGRPCDKGSSCRYGHLESSLTRLLACLRTARRTLDVAVYHLSCEEICAEVVEAARRGVAVRVITDVDQREGPHSDVDRLLAAGIPVRVNAAGGGLMHHKFAVADGGLLLTGSFNWTRHCVTANHENILVTHDATLAGAYAREFQMLWGYCEPLAAPHGMRPPVPIARPAPPLEQPPPQAARPLFAQAAPRPAPAPPAPAPALPRPAALPAPAASRELRDPRLSAPDARAGTTAVYRVVTATSNLPDAGTDASVVLRLTGSQRDAAGVPLCVERTLSGGTTDLFERNQEDTFQFETAYLGALTKVGLELRPSTAARWTGKTEWHADSLSIVDVAGGREWDFSIREWFGRGGASAEKWWSAAEGPHGLTPLEAAGGRPADSYGGPAPSHAVSRSGSRARYRVLTATSDLPRAGTDASVLLKLCGTEREAASGAPVRCEHMLTASSRNLFEAAQTDAFEFESMYLGDLTAATLELRPSAAAGLTGKHDWHLDSLTIVDIVSGREWRFGCRAWFSREAGLAKGWSREGGPAGLALMEAPVPRGTSSSLPGPPRTPTREMRMSAGPTAAGPRVRDMAQKLNATVAASGATAAPARSPNTVRNFTGHAMMKLPPL